jgi:hypothetical protein
VIFSLLSPDVVDASCALFSILPPLLQADLSLPLSSSITLFHTLLSCLSFLPTLASPSSSLPLALSPRHLDSPDSPSFEVRFGLMSLVSEGGRDGEEAGVARVDEEGWRGSDGAEEG